MSAVPYRSTFMRLLGFLRPYRAGLVLSIFLAVGSQAAQIALVWITGRGVIDHALLDHDTRRLWISVAAIVGLGLVRAAMMAGRRLISGRQALDVEMDMRSGLYAHLVRLSFGFYDRHQTGQLMSRATVDLQGVRFFLGYGLIFFFQNVLTVVSVAVVLFFVEWRLALIVLAVTPLLVLLAYRYSHIAHPTLREVQQRLADVATVAEENIVGVHVVKAFAQEPAQQAKFNVRSERVFEQTLRANRQRATYVPLISFVPLLAQAAVLLLGARMVKDGSLTPGSFVAFNLYLGDARAAPSRARHVDRAGTARDRGRRAHLRDHRRAGRGGGPAGRGRAAAGRRSDPLQGRLVRVPAGTARCWRGVDLEWRRAARSRSSATPAPARRRSRRSCRGSTTSPEAGSRSTASTFAT